LIGCLARVIDRATKEIRRRQQYYRTHKWWLTKRKQKTFGAYAPRKTVSKQ